MQFIWKVTEEKKDLVNKIIRETGISSVVAKIIAARGLTDIQEIKEFLDPKIEHTHSPYLLHDMEKSVNLIRKAIAENKRILIYGDYDGDGITGTSILLLTLRRLGANVDYVLPNRFKHGYGPNSELFKEKINEGFDVILTVDNGVSGVEEVKLAKELGATVIITDHHEFGEKLPAADAVVHPRHPNGSYPFHDLAGVGVAYKLAVALLNGEEPSELQELLAIGTIADMVQLRDENRYYVREGLKHLKNTKNLGLLALSRIGKFDLAEADEEMIGFSIGPRLNAPGRIGDPNIVVKMLTSSNENVVTNIAFTVEDYNTRRKEMTTILAEEVQQQIEDKYGENIPTALVLAKEGWETGISGIAASRTLERFYRPTIILSIDKETGIAKGSARSIEGFNLHEVLNDIQRRTNLLESFGGHSMAAGLSLKVENVEAFRNELISTARQLLNEEDLIPIKEVDVEVDLTTFGFSELNEINAIGPYGMGFKKPLFLMKDVYVSEHKLIGEFKNHYKGKLQSESRTMDVISFFNSELMEKVNVGSKVSAIGTFNVNEWNGSYSLQFMLDDMKVTENQFVDLRNRIVDIPEEEKISFCENSPYYFQKINYQDKPSIHLIDLPFNDVELEKFLINGNYKSLSFSFNNQEILDRFPTRKDFEFIYRGILENGYAYKRTDSKQVVLDVFEELGFIQWTTNNNYIPIYSPHKQPLDNSLLYRELMTKRYYVEQMLGMNIENLKEVFSK